MPNWTGNRLFVTGPRLEVERFRKQAAGESDDKVTPTGSKKTEEESRCLTFKRFVVLQKKKRKISDDAMISLAVRMWGTKWDACDPVLVTKRPNRLRYEFGTAWTPPVNWLVRVSRMYPKLAFRMRYDGSGFRGVALYKKGKGKNTVLSPYFP